MLPFSVIVHWTTLFSRLATMHLFILIEAVFASNGVRGCCDCMCVCLGGFGHLNKKSIRFTLDMHICNAMPDSGVFGACISYVRD